MKTNVSSKQPFKRYGDKRNSDYFEEYLLKIYHERDKSGLTENLQNIETVVLQIDSGEVRNYITELSIMTPYQYVRSFEDEMFRYHLLDISHDNPDFLIREPLKELHDNKNIIVTEADNNMGIVVIDLIAYQSEGERQLNTDTYLSIPTITPIIFNRIYANLKLILNNKKKQYTRLVSLKMKKVKCLYNDA